MSLVDKVKSVGRNAFFGAGLLAASSLATPSAYALNASITEQGSSDAPQSAIFENRYLPLNAQIGDRASTDTYVVRTWDFDDGTTSGLAQPSHKWAVDGSTTKTITLTANEYTTPGQTLVDTAITTHALYVLETPTTTTSRLASLIEEKVGPGAVEGVDYLLRNPSPGVDTIVDTVADEAATTLPLFLDLDKGEYLFTFPFQPLERSDLYLVGNTRHRGDSISDGFEPYDINGLEESTIVGGPVILSRDRSGIYDIIYKENTDTDTTLFALDGNLPEVKGIISYYPGPISFRIADQVTTATFEDNLFLHSSGQIAIEVNDGNSLDDKSGILVLNSRFDQDRTFAAARFVELQGTGEPATAITAEAYITMIGSIVDPKMDVMRVTRQEGAVGEFVNQYLDAGVENLQELQDRIVVEGVSPRLNDKRGFSLQGAGTEIIYAPTEEEIRFEKGGENFNVTGLILPKEVTIDPDPPVTAVGNHWMMFQ